MPTIAPTADATVAVGVFLFLTASLTERVEDALELVSRGEWLKVYKFQSPAFRESCPNGAFAAEATFGLSYLRNLLGIPLTDPLEFRLVSVLVDGTTGYVETQIYHDGEPVVFGWKTSPRSGSRSMVSGGTIHRLDRLGVPIEDPQSLTVFSPGPLT